MVAARSCAWPLIACEAVDSVLARINHHHVAPPQNRPPHPVNHGRTPSHQSHQKWGAKCAGEEGGRPRAPQAGPPGRLSPWRSYFSDTRWALRRPGTHPSTTTSSRNPIRHCEARLLRKSSSNLSRTLSSSPMGPSNQRQALRHPTERQAPRVQGFVIWGQRHAQGQKFTLPAKAYGANLPSGTLFSVIRPEGR